MESHKRQAISSQFVFVRTFEGQELINKPVPQNAYLFLIGGTAEAV